MKTIIRTSLAVLAAAVLACSSAAAQPSRERGSDSQRPDRNEWYQKMKAQKIAFFTSEIGLTEAEAKAFWPIYDAAEQAQRESSRKVMEAYRNLMAAVREDKPDSEIGQLLDAYVQASQESKTIDPAVIRQYENILPAKKVAKILVAEEKFRQQQIRQLHSQNGPQNGSHGAPHGGFEGSHDSHHGSHEGFGGSHQGW